MDKNQQHPKENSFCNLQESVRSCCERTLSEHWIKTQQQQRDSGGQSRQPRAAPSPDKTENITSTTTTSCAPGTRTQTLPRPPARVQNPPPRPATTPSDMSATMPPSSHSVLDLTMELDDNHHSDDSSLKEVKQKERQSRSPAPPAAVTGVTQPTGGAEGVQGGVAEVHGEVVTAPQGVEVVRGGAAEVPGGAAEEVQWASGNRLRPPRTPRTDEAVWAAAALGFLLVLLALSVLHTRLYRHWRRAPSLYWHHPQDHYDSVAGKDQREIQYSSDSAHFISTQFTAVQFN